MTNLTKKEWEKAFDAIRDIVTIQDPTMRIRHVNLAARRAFQTDESDLVGKHCYEIFRGESEPCQDCPGAQAIFHAQGHISEIEHKNLNKIFLVSASPIIEDNGELSGIVHIATDITEQKKNERKSLQALKMESVGRLASGVAHDLNNILTPILGYCDMIQQRIDEHNPLWQGLDIIKSSGEKAATITNQLLAFSRRQPLLMKGVNLNSLLLSQAKNLENLLQDDISLDIDTDLASTNILADPAQIEQILMNLAANARDVMPFGGKLWVQTRNVEINGDIAADHQGLQPGHYVKLTVADTGSGMSSEVQERIFEPFFTTKGIGQGPGLGLAMIYGVVKQHNGYITVHSEIGQGTVFEIYFPLTDREVQPAVESLENSAPGKETLVVVEDDPFVRALIADSLHPMGYKVLGAASGEESLTISDSYPDRIHIFLIDVIMPGMNGPETAKKLEQARPDAKIIFMSGYTDEVIHDSDFQSGKTYFIQKPLILNKLKTMIREVLEQ